MRRLWILVCVLMMPCVTSARTNRGAWENLSALQAGQKIQVVEMNSKKDKGKFLSASDTAITLQGEAGVQTIQRQDVRNVKLTKQVYRLRNALIGAGIGAGAGAGVGAAAYGPPPGFWGGRGAHAAIGAVFGFVGGVVIGALWPSHKTIYRAKAQ